MLGHTGYKNRVCRGRARDAVRDSDEEEKEREGMVVAMRKDPLSSYQCGSAQNCRMISDT
jgi:hypothetical protein